MTVTGIIAEYNPFHEGHRYHIEESKKQTGADYVVVVMSGDFVQRGEAAITDKYIRAQMALDGGADLILEMPAYYATASAEYFATAGVGILDALGCVDYLSFGSEWADMDSLAEIAQILVEEPSYYKMELKKCLEEGQNYPQARENALICCLPEEKYAHILKLPNHILAVEYLKALYRKESRIKPHSILRKGSDYHAADWNADKNIYPSATALRQILAEGRDFQSLSAGMQNAEELWQLYQAGDYVSWKDLMPLLDYVVLMKRKVLGKYFGMDYDLSQRITHLYKPGKTFEELIEICHSRNYTDAALRRMFLHVVLGMKEVDFLEEAAQIPIPYVRVLGLRKESGKLLSRIREESRIPLFQRPVEGKILEKTDAIGHLLYMMDLRCADLYEQLASTKAGREFRNEFTRNMVIR